MNTEKDNPDPQVQLVNTLLNYSTPHYSVRFTILGCPAGLEILDMYEHLVINRRFQNLIDLHADKRLLAYQQFEVTNSRGMQLYIALEKVKRRSLNWIRDARLFEVSFFDFHCRKVFTVKRKFSFKYCFAQYLCLFFTYGFKGCGNVIEVSLPNGTLLGRVKQNLSFSSTTFQVYNGKGEYIMVIDGVVSDGILDVKFPNEEEPIAMIETLMNDVETLDFYRVSVPVHSSVTGITFFKNFVTADQKALLLATTLLLDYIALKPTSDYPHVCEVIPDDYQEYPVPQSKLHRQESRELLILMEGKESRKYTFGFTSRLKGRWGPCIWCGKLMCMCCSLALRRNALRCIGLLIASILLVIGFGIFAVIIIRFLYNRHILVNK